MNLKERTSCPFYAMQLWGWKSGTEQGYQTTALERSFHEFNKNLHSGLKNLLLKQKLFFFFIGLFWIYPLFSNLYFTLLFRSIELFL